MAVSSIKGCWFKFSARIRDYMEIVDSYYRPVDDGSDPSKFRDSTTTTNGYHHHRRHNCDRSATKDSHNNENSNKSSHRHHHSCFEHKSSSRHHRTNNQHESRNQLPPGFSKRKTLDGQVYFVDPSGRKYWYDPSVPRELLTASLNLDLDLLVGQLSANWEIRHTSSGKTYYVDHQKKTTQFTDPRLVAYKDQLMEYLRHTKYATFTSGSNPCAVSLNGLNRAQTNNIRGALPLSSPNSQSMDANHNDNNDTSMSHNSNSNSCHHHSQRQNNKNHSDGKSKSSQNGSHCRRHANSAQVIRSSHSNLMLGSLHNLSTTSQLPNNSGQSGTLTRRPLASQEQSTASNNSLRQPTLPSNNNCQIYFEPTSLNRSSTSVNNLHQISQNDSFNVNSSKTHQTTTNRDLFDKISILRQELLKQQVLAHPCRIDINRKRIFEESFRVVSQSQPRDLKKRLLIKFRGEEGLDYGGVAREWFYLLSRKMLNPMHGLFQYTSDDIYNLQINPDSGIVYREHLSYLNFCGRIIGMAVFHGHFIEGHFTRPFYKMLLRKPITLEDIENVDPDLHRSLCWILENDITNVIDTTFLVQHNALGQLQEHELKKNGRNITVSEENKHEYVSLYVNYRCRRGIENQFEALQRGFYELISPSLVENFNEYELELLIGGLSKIDVEDWRLHTKLKNCTIETPLVRWFWELVKSYSEDKRAQLLQFVTGSPRVPIQGFKALQGVNSELRLFTIHLIRNACTDNLPKSHTCFNRIDLPPYESYEKLRDKITQAIEETMGFAMQ